MPDRSGLHGTNQLLVLNSAALKRSILIIHWLHFSAMLEIIICCILVAQMISICFSLYRTHDYSYELWHTMLLPVTVQSTAGERLPPKWLTMTLCRVGRYTLLTHSPLHTVISCTWRRMQPDTLYIASHYRKAVFAYDKHSPRLLSMTTIYTP